MKTTAEDEEEKRLQRNSRRRERYAQLSKEKKAAMLEQNRKAYANRSEIEKLEKNLARRKAHAALPLKKKEAALKKNRQRYPDMNERDKFGQESLAKDKGEEAVRFNDNREDEARFRSTFEIGSSSSDPFGVTHPLMNSSLLPPGFTHKVKYYYGCYDPLQYPLLFPYGQSGWHEGIERANRRIETLCAGQLLIDPNRITSAEQIIEQEEKILAAAKKKRNTVSCREYYCYNTNEA